MTVLRQTEPAAAKGFRSWVVRNPVVAFVALAYGFSWLAWLPGLLGLGGMVSLLIGGLGPLVAGLVVTRYIGESVRAWWRPVWRWRVPLRYYAYALGLPPLLYGLVDMILVLLDYDLDPWLLLERAPAYLGTLLFVAVLAGGLEEPGWRGFALPHLQQRHTPVVATLVLGLAWGVWHIPLYGPLGFVVPLVLAFFYTWLYNRTGSVLLCILLHASFTPAQDHLILLPANTIHPGGGVNTIDLVIIGTYLLAALALVVLTLGRLGKEPAPRPTVEKRATPAPAIAEGRIAHYPAARARPSIPIPTAANTASKG